MHFHTCSHILFLTFWYLFIWFLCFCLLSRFVLKTLHLHRVLGQMNMLWSRSWSPGAMRKYMPWTLLIRMVSWDTGGKNGCKSLSFSFNMQYITYPHFTAYKKTLEEAIQSDTSGHFCRILVSLVQVTFIIMRTKTVFNFHAHSLVAVCLLTVAET